MSDITNVEKILNEGRTIQFTPKGTSMYPLFITHKDSAVVVPLDKVKRKLKRGDVCLYKKEDGMLVIHRICRITEEAVWFVGDHQVEIEGPLSIDCVKGIMVSFVRNNKEWSANNPVYIIVSRLWLFIRPIRLKLIKIGSKMKKIVN